MKMIDPEEGGRHEPHRANSRPASGGFHGQSGPIRFIRNAAGRTGPASRMGARPGHWLRHQGLVFFLGAAFTFVTTRSLRNSVRSTSKTTSSSFGSRRL